MVNIPKDLLHRRQWLTTRRVDCRDDGFSRAVRKSYPHSRTHHVTALIVARDERDPNVIDKYNREYKCWGKDARGWSESVQREGNATDNSKIRDRHQADVNAYIVSTNVKLAKSPVLFASRFWRYLIHHFKYLLIKLHLYMQS